MIPGSRLYYPFYSMDLIEQTSEQFVLPEFDVDAVFVKLVVRVVATQRRA